MCPRAPLPERASPDDGSRLAPVRAALRRGPAASSQRRLGPSQSSRQLQPSISTRLRSLPSSLVQMRGRVWTRPFPPPSGARFPPVPCQPSPWWRLCWSTEPGAVAGCGLGKLAGAPAVFSVHFLHLVPRSKPVLAWALTSRLLVSYSPWVSLTTIQTSKGLIFPVRPQDGDAQYVARSPHSSEWVSELIISPFTFPFIISESL